MHLHRCPDIVRYRTMDTAALRQGFLVADLFEPGLIRLVYTDLDRAIIGSAVPGATPLDLEAGAALRADYFCERRELGVLNLGGPGAVEIDGTRHPLDKLECLYVGRGSRHVAFTSADSADPAAFYLLSYPAHAAFPTTKACLADANRLELGSKADANERHLYQYIHEHGIRSCQLVMGFTILQPGSVWNTMPPHTHDRRSEVYLYFDLAAGHRVAHFMGEPHETRALWVGEKQAVLSPSWSVHCGAGTNSYSFVWGMGGENQRFNDMDPAPIADLR